MTKKVFEINKFSGLKPVDAQLGADVMFITGALRAAKNSSPEIRQKILSDIQTFTNTSASAVEFMFAPNNDNNDHSVFDMPDSQRRRKLICDNHLDAAE